MRISRVPVPLATVSPASAVTGGHEPVGGGDLFA